MKELEHLKELYLEEIKKINKKGELTPADSDAAKKALEAIEKIDEICECYEDENEYSERMMPRRSMGNRHMYPYYNNRSMMPDMRPYDTGYEYGDRYSERRGRSSTTGRYISRHDGLPVTVDRMIHKLEDMKMDAPDDDTRMAIQHVITKLEDY